MARNKKEISIIESVGSIDELLFDRSGKDAVEELLPKIGDIRTDEMNIEELPAIMEPSAENTIVTKNITTSEFLDVQPNVNEAASSDLFTGVDTETTTLDTAVPSVPLDTTKLETQEQKIEIPDNLIVDTQLETREQKIEFPEQKLNTEVSDNLIVDTKLETREQKIEFPEQKLNTEVSDNLIADTQSGIREQKIEFPEQKLNTETLNDLVADTEIKTQPLSIEPDTQKLDVELPSNLVATLELPEVKLPTERELMLPDTDTALTPNVTKEGLPTNKTRTVQQRVVETSNNESQIPVVTLAKGTTLVWNGSALVVM